MEKTTKLYDEYFSRHSMNVHFIRPAIQNYYLFLRNKEHGKVSMLCLHSYKDKGFFKFGLSLTEPVKDGIFMFNLSKPSLELEWDEYFIEFPKFIREYISEYDVITNVDEAYLAAWEMYLLMNESWLAANISCDKIYSTVSLDLNVLSKVKNLNELVKNFCGDNSVRVAWTCSMMNCFNNYGYWIEPFLNLGVSNDESHIAGRN